MQHVIKTVFFFVLLTGMVTCVYGEMIIPPRLSVNGIDASLPLSYSVDPEKPGFVTFTLDNPIIVGDANDGAILYKLQGTLDPDPAITYEMKLADFGAVSSISFTVATSTEHISGPNRVNSHLTGEVTQGDGFDEVAVTALSPSTVPTDEDETKEIQIATVSDNNGASWVNMGVDLGPSKSHGPGVFALDYGPYSEGDIMGPRSESGWNSLRIDVNFIVSGNGDIATLSGEANIRPLLCYTLAFGRTVCLWPMPMIIILTLSTAVAVSAAVWYRRRRSR